MRILNLTLENFQGFKQKTFNFEGKNISIFGDNATGKTTIFNAVTYLLFDKASTGAKNFTPKTKDKNGDAHHLNHSVEAAFQLDDGRMITLKKVFHENYRKKRGSAAEEFDGHSIDFFIDGVPVKEKDYQETLLSFCEDIERMKILTMPDYFSENLKWDARRKILLDICGDITDDDVIAANQSLKELPQFLIMPGTANQQYSIEEYRKIAKSQTSKINKQLQDIPGRIDEAKRAMPDIKSIDPIRLDEILNRLQAEKESLEQQKNQIMQGNTEAISIQQKFAEIKTILIQAKAEYLSNSNNVNEATYISINQSKEKQMRNKSNLIDYRNNLRREKEALNQMQTTRSRLLQQYKDIQKGNWDEANETCPTCGQLLSIEKINEAKEKFNLAKSAHLESINKQGQEQASKAMIAEKEAAIEGLEESIRSEEESIENIAKEIINLQSQIKNALPFEETSEYKTINNKLILLEEEEHNAGALTERETAEINQKIADIKVQIQDQEEKKMQLKIAEQQTSRIAQLEEEEKKLSEQFEQIQHGIYLCEQFVKSKVNMLTDKINSKFENVRFKLFIEQLNGGLKEDCEVMIPTEEGNLVDYTLANNAARINAGLEIIDVISTHWNLSMPVFVDNAESVTRLKEIGSQVIRLVVSEQDQELRMVG